MANMRGAHVKESDMPEQERTESEPTWKERAMKRAMNPPLVKAFELGPKVRPSRSGKAECWQEDWCHGP